MDFSYQSCKDEIRPMPVLGWASVSPGGGVSGLACPHPYPGTQNTTPAADSMSGYPEALNHIP